MSLRPSALAALAWHGLPVTAVVGQRPACCHESPNLGPLPSIDVADALLDERRALTRSATRSKIVAYHLKKLKSRQLVEAHMIFITKCDTSSGNDKTPLADEGPISMSAAPADRSYSEAERAQILTQELAFLTQPTSYSGRVGPGGRSAWAHAARKSNSVGISQPSCGRAWIMLTRPTSSCTRSSQL